MSLVSLTEVVFEHESVGAVRRLDVTIETSAQIGRGGRFIAYSKRFVGGRLPYRLEFQNTLAFLPNTEKRVSFDAA